MSARRIAWDRLARKLLFASATVLGVAAAVTVGTTTSASAIPDDGFRDPEPDDDSESDNNNNSNNDESESDNNNSNNNDSESDYSGYGGGYDVSASDIGFGSFDDDSDDVTTTIASTTSSKSSAESHDDSDSDSDSDDHDDSDSDDDGGFFDAFGNEGSAVESRIADRSAEAAALEATSLNISNPTSVLRQNENTEVADLFEPVTVESLGFVDRPAFTLQVAQSGDLIDGLTPLEAELDALEEQLDADDSGQSTAEETPEGLVPESYLGAAKGGEAYSRAISNATRDSLSPELQTNIDAAFSEIEPDAYRPPNSLAITNLTDDAQEAANQQDFQSGQTSLYEASRLASTDAEREQVAKAAEALESKRSTEIDQLISQANDAAANNDFGLAANHLGRADDLANQVVEDPTLEGFRSDDGHAEAIESAETSIAIEQLDAYLERLEVGLTNEGEDLDSLVPFSTSQVGSRGLLPGDFTGTTVNNNIRFNDNDVTIETDFVDGAYKQTTFVDGLTGQRYPASPQARLEISRLPQTSASQPQTAPPETMIDLPDTNDESEPDAQSEQHVHETQTDIAGNPVPPRGRTTDEDGNFVEPTMQTTTTDENGDRVERQYYSTPDGNWIQNGGPVGPVEQFDDEHNGDLTEPETKRDLEVEPTEKAEPEAKLAPGATTTPEVVAQLAAWIAAIRDQQPSTPRRRIVPVDIDR